MSVLDILLAAEAADRHAAVRRTAYRHRSLSPEPLVVTVYNMAGEAAAPLAFYFGTSPSGGTLIVAPEPRNREVRFEGINAFSAAFTAYINPFLRTRTELVGRRGHQFELEVAIEAPQIVVPNRATREYLGTRLGRSLRYLGLGTTHTVPEATQWAGAHLSWLAEYAHMPGQSIFVAATELLSRHFATGQSALEDENLATLLAWIENKPGSGLTKIRAAETGQGAFGPVADPDLDRKLEPHVRAFGIAAREGDAKVQARIRPIVESLVRTPLENAYRATHRALAIMSRIPEASSAADRAERDLREWGSHVRRCARQIPRFSRRHDALRAARLLESWSRAQDELDIVEAFDDPLVMARHDAEGRCISGRVLGVDLDNREIKPGNKRPTSVPLVEVSAPSAPQLLVGDEVVWAGDIHVEAEIRDIKKSKDRWTVELAIMGGHKNGERLPAVRTDTVFAALRYFSGKSPAMPDVVPWTHRVSDVDVGSEDTSTGASAEPEVEEADIAAANTEDEIGPDLRPEDVVAPIRESRDPDEVPGVVL